MIVSVTVAWLLWYVVFMSLVVEKPPECVVPHVHEETLRRQGTACCIGVDCIYNWLFELCGMMFSMLFYLSCLLLNMILFNVCVFLYTSY